VHRNSSPKMGQRGHQIRFLAIGIWNTIFGISLFYFLAVKNLNSNYQVALFCCFIISTAQSHYAQRRLVWFSKQKYFPELLKFFMGTSGMYAVNVVLLPLFVEGFQLDLLFSQCAVTLILTIFSFWFQGNFVFFRNTTPRV
jgi:putative flippase GtrA